MVAIDAPPFVDGLGEPSIRPYASEDHKWACELLDSVGGRLRVRRGRVIDTAVLAGLVGMRDGHRNTLVTITRHRRDFELSVIASNPFDPELVQLVIRAALQYRQPGASRAYAICSNAQFGIQRALQNADFRLCATRPGAMEAVGRRSPHPLVSHFGGLPVRDEIEFDFLIR